MPISLGTNGITPRTITRTIHHAMGIGNANNRNPLPTRYVVGMW